MKREGGGGRRAPRCVLMRIALAMVRFGAFALPAAILAMHPSAALSAAPEMFLREEPESYLIIDKLDGMGLLPELMTGDRGLEAREVFREAGKAKETDDPFVDGMVQFLRLGGETDRDFRIRIGPEYSRHGQVPPNAQGLPVLKDGGIRTGGFFRLATTEWLGLQARGDLLAGADGDRFGRIEETSIRLGWPQATVEAGRFSLWWGPGRHGALLFTTNAEPLTGVRFRNPRPIAFGGWFSFLGLVQYDLFVARLEGSRPIPHSMLSGMRVAIKPNSWLELGASRAMHFGGQGRGNGLSEWWTAFQGTKENDPGSQGNQLGGFDISATLPFRAQPVRVYLEVAGEDQAGGHGIPLPAKWSYLAGVFLPSVFGSPRLDLRIEVAQNHLKGNGPIWYVHGSSGEGYAHRYRGRILGHHMGTDAKDLFLEAHYFLLSSSYLELNVDQTQRYSPGPAREDARRISTAFVGWLTRNLRGEGRLAFESATNEGGISGSDSRDVSIQAGIAYQYR